MTTTWIIAADSSRARILQVMDRDARLAEVEDFVNPQGRAHERDLMADGHPRWSGHGGMGKPGGDSNSGPGSDRQETSPTEHAVEIFAKQIGDYLDKARNDHRYDRLHLVAPPKFLGQLRKELGKEVQKLVTEELPKDLSWLDARDLEKKLLGKGSGRAP
jgi:protein required for attachment to host cells